MLQTTFSGRKVDGNLHTDRTSPVSIAVRDRDSWSTLSPHNTTRWLNLEPCSWTEFLSSYWQSHTKVRKHFLLDGKFRSLFGMFGLPRMSLGTRCRREGDSRMIDFLRSWSEIGLLFMELLFKKTEVFLISWSVCGTHTKLYNFSPSNNDFNGE